MKGRILFVHLRDVLGDSYGKISRIYKGETK